VSATSGRDHASRFCRVLIAAAEADTRDLYRQCLLATRCDVIEAADGREALVSTFTLRPSLVITEARLPHFDGYQLLEVLRRDVMTREVPVLIVTTDSLDTELKRARDAGADSVLIKPVSPAALLQEVQRLLKQDPQL